MNAFVGDWNAKVGARTREELAVGYYGVGERNEKGRLLVTFCEVNNLRGLLRVSILSRRTRTWFRWSALKGKGHRLREATFGAF